MDKDVASLMLWSKNQGISMSGVGARQPGLFPKRLGTKYGTLHNGRDVAFTCEAEEGGTYVCKHDAAGQPARLNDWVGTKLASHLGIATAECAVVEDHDGQTYFGSLIHSSTQDDFLLKRYLSTPQADETGRPMGWLGQHLAGLFALDLFLSNPDRDRQNFVLRSEGQRQVLCAIDFASARLDRITSREFPIASTRTIFVGKDLQRLHGRHEASAIEMVDRIAAIPVEIVERFFLGIPDSWSNAAQKEGICDAWAGRGFHDRLAALRAVIRDGTLL